MDREENIHHLQKTKNHLKINQLNQCFNIKKADLFFTPYSIYLERPVIPSAISSDKTIKPPVESEKPLRKPCDLWARSAEEKATLLAYHLSEVFKLNPHKN